MHAALAFNASSGALRHHYCIHRIQGTNDLHDFLHSQSMQFGAPSQHSDMAGQFTASGPGQWGFWPRWLMSVAAYGVLIAVQAGMPLQFNTPTARKFDTPITPAA